VGLEGGMTFVSVGGFGLWSFVVSPVNESSAFRLTPKEADGLMDGVLAVEEPCGVGLGAAEAGFSEFLPTTPDVARSDPRYCNNRVSELILTETKPTHTHFGCFAQKSHSAPEKFVERGCYILENANLSWCCGYNVCVRSRIRLVSYLL
jgi:hypothetical protein